MEKKNIQKESISELKSRNVPESNSSTLTHVVIIIISAYEPFMIQLMPRSSGVVGFLIYSHCWFRLPALLKEKKKNSYKRN